MTFEKLSRGPKTVYPKITLEHGVHMVENYPREAGQEDEPHESGPPEELDRTVSRGDVRVTFGKSDL